MTHTEDLLRIDPVDGDAGQVVLRLTGEIDPHTAGDLTEAVKPYVDDADVDALVLDLGGVGFIDSSGLRVLIATDQALAGRDAKLVLRSPSESTRRLLEITDLLDRLNVE